MRPPGRGRLTRRTPLGLGARSLERKSTFAAEPRASKRRPSDVARVFNLTLKGEACCRNCGASERLHLHHAVPRSMCRAARCDLRNGIALCAGCHHGWHHRLTTIYRDLFTEEEWAFISSLELLGQNIAAWLDDRYPPRPNLRGTE
jgi:hypothetical protein